MEIKYYWQCQQVEQGFLQFNYIFFEENTADSFTKSLEINSFKAYRDNLIKITNIYSPNIQSPD